MELQRLKLGSENFKPVYITDRYKHITMPGKSGEGKSNMFLNWIQQDSYWPYSKCIIDPSGSLAKDSFSLLKGKANYCSLKNPIGLNPMDAPYSDDTISDTISESVNQMIGLTTPNDKFTAKMRVIVDDKVKYCLKTNRKSLLFVRDEVAKITTGVETRDGILSRLNFILSDPRMEKILCGKGIQWGELIQKGQSFILDCFDMSREKMIFTGCIVAQGIKNYLRHEMPKERKPLALYIDECHNFLNLSFADALKEGRRAKLSVVMASQDFAVIDEKLARLMLNVGNIVSFKLGAREARMVAPELGMKSEDLQFIEKYHCGYMTPKERGICKAPRPPIISELKLKLEAPKSKSKGWFVFESYQPV